MEYLETIRYFLEKICVRYRLDLIEGTDHDELEGCKWLAVICAYIFRLEYYQSITTEYTPNVYRATPLFTSYS